MADDDEEYDVKMEEGEYFAIETFGTTGSGRVHDEVSFDYSVSTIRRCRWRNSISIGCLFSLREDANRSKGSSSVSTVDLFCPSRVRRPDQLGLY